MQKKVIIGIDIGGTNTSFGFVDESGTLLAGSNILTFAEEEVLKYVKRLSVAINETYSKNLKDYCIEAIGVAAPGGNHFLGTIEAPSNFNWKNVNFVEIMKDQFNVPVAITNDANAAALGELTFGSAMGMKNCIVITLGTGLGSGIIVNGEMLYGHSGLAGELGHIIVEQNGRQCKCGRSGCLETYASANGIRRTVFQLLSEFNEESALRNIPFDEMTGKTITELGEGGDTIALKAFDFTGKILGMALANAAACFSPEAFVLCGGLVNSGELLLEPTRRYFEENVLNVYKGKIKIKASKLQNGKAAILGARNIVLKELNKAHSPEVNN